MKNKITMIIMGIVLLLISISNFTFGQCASIANIYSFDYNGHTYDVIKENKTWVQATACAVERSGYLAEINDQAEQDAIYNEISNNAGINSASTVATEGGGAAYLWLGGSDAGTEGTWILDGNNDGVGSQFWQGLSNGHAVGELYSNWGYGTDAHQHEPDNWGNGGSIPHQNALAIALGQWPSGSGSLGQASQWNDIWEGNTLYYIVEHNTIVVDPSVPSGTGASGDPYQIGTFDHLLWIQNHSAEWDKYYIQTANITAEPYGSENWDRIGTNGNAFTGTYDGQNYAIDGLVIDTVGYGAGASANQRGFFGVTSNATISNIGVINVSIINIARVGALIGECRGSSITNCLATGTVTGVGAHVGGLIGYVQETTPTTISDCYSECAVINDGAGSSLYTGGLIGSLNNATVTNSYSLGDVIVSNGSGGTCVGGFVGIIGTVTAGTVSKCYSTGSVTGTAVGSWSCAGGFVGWLKGGTISESYGRGNVSGYERVGGFAGYTRYAVSKIENCYSIGNVSRSGVSTKTQFGGFVGYNRESAEIKNCYSVGIVTSDGSTNKGFVGFESGGVETNCFYDKDASGQTGTQGTAVGETTLNMQEQVTFESAYWNFTDTWEVIDTPAEGLAKVNAGNYPRLQHQKDQALPIELTTFTASTNANMVSLLWTTATEVNNHGFEIERQMSESRIKYQDKNWEKVGFVNGAGNSSSPKNYSYSEVANLAGKYYYRLKQVDIDGSYEYSQVVVVTIGVPDKFEVSQNYPNPFNPTTVISFSLPTNVNVELVVYNAIGEVVSTLLNEELNAGLHKINFDGSNLTSGIYFYKISAGNNTVTQKMILMK